VIWKVADASVQYGTPPLLGQSEHRSAYIVAVPRLADAGMNTLIIETVGPGFIELWIDDTPKITFFNSISPSTSTVKDTPNALFVIYGIKS
jgi:hypothetical protein